MARNDPDGRVRVLVDLGSSVGDPLIRALPPRLYHRGKRLRQLALLGLAAETAGLRIETAADGWPVLRGENVALIRLDEGGDAPMRAQPKADVQPEAPPRPPDVVLPSGFLDQFLS